MYAVLRFVDQHAILRRDFRNQHLPTLPDHRLDVAQKKTRHSSAELFPQDLDFVRSRELGRVDTCSEPLSLSPRHGDGIWQRTPFLRLAAVISSRQRRVRLAIVASV